MIEFKFNHNLCNESCGGMNLDIVRGFGLSEGLHLRNEPDPSYHYGKNSLLLAKGKPYSPSGRLEVIAPLTALNRGDVNHLLPKVLRESRETSLFLGYDLLPYKLATRDMDRKTQNPMKKSLPH